MAPKIFFRRLDLQLFADGSAGGGGAGTGSDGATGVSATDAGAQKAGVKKGSNPLADVKYGIQTEIAEPVPAAEEQKTKSTTEENLSSRDLDAEFDALIKGKYKDVFNKRNQDIVRQRLKGPEESAKKYKVIAPVLDLLSKRYGVDASDINALSKAVEDDNAYYEQEAMEKGVSVETLKAMKKVERENAELRRQIKERETEESAKRQYAAWFRQAEDTKTVYPSFDLEKELAASADFAKLLNAGVDVRTAFEVIHKDEILPAAMQYTAKVTEDNVLNQVRANGARPRENGMSGQSAAKVKSKVSELSKADIAEINRRVAMGEKISFG
ncbi:MAG: hypothetical protein IJX08_07870 [Clostridia bacterium]|nr:hypothetical protein [Clostridia bacterium]